MPTYQYACTECDHAFEQFQNFSENSLTVCPRCQGRLRKVFNAVGVVFKGSGFYRNDSRSAPVEVAAKADGSSDGAKSDSKSDSKSEVKAGPNPDAKGDAKPVAASTTSKEGSAA